MKNLSVVILLMLAMASSAQAQKLMNGKDLATMPEIEFCDIMLRTIPGSQAAYLNYGQESKRFQHKNFDVAGEDGKIMKFKEFFGIFLHMHSLGWELHTTYQCMEPEGMKQVLKTHYIFRRKKS